MVQCMAWRATLGSLGLSVNCFICLYGGGGVVFGIRCLMSKSATAPLTHWLRWCNVEQSGAFAAVGPSLQVCSKMRVVQPYMLLLRHACDLEEMKTWCQFYKENCT